MIVIVTSERHSWPARRSTVQGIRGFNPDLVIGFIDRTLKIGYEPRGLLIRAMRLPLKVRFVLALLQYEMQEHCLSNRTARIVVGRRDEDLDRVVLLNLSSLASLLLFMAALLRHGPRQNFVYTYIASPPIPQLKDHVLEWAAWRSSAWWLRQGSRLGDGLAGSQALWR